MKLPAHIITLAKTAAGIDASNMTLVELRAAYHELWGKTTDQYTIVLLEAMDKHEAAKKRTVSRLAQELMAK